MPVVQFNGVKCGPSYSDALVLALTLELLLIEMD